MVEHSELNSQKESQQANLVEREIDHKISLLTPAYKKGFINKLAGGIATASLLLSACSSAVRPIEVTRIVTATPPAPGQITETAHVTSTAVIEPTKTIELPKLPVAMTATSSPDESTGQGSRVTIIKPEDMPTAVYATPGAKRLDSDVKPTASSTPAPTTEAPAATAVPTEAEIKEPQDVKILGFVDPDPKNRLNETIKLYFPQEIVSGKQPLISEGDKLVLNLNFKSATRIEDLNISLTDLLDIKTAKYTTGVTLPNDVKTNDVKTVDIARGIDGLIRNIHKDDPSFKISDAGQKVLSEVELKCYYDKEGGLRVALIAPHESFTYTDKFGTHLINPFERFIKGDVGFGIRRRGDDPSQALVGNIPLQAKEILMWNGQGRVVATAKDFDINSPVRIKVVSGESTSTTGSTIRIATVTPDISTPSSPNSELPHAMTATSSESVPSGPNQENDPLAKKWIHEYKVGDYVSLRDWYDDMVQKRFIENNIPDQSIRDQVDGVINNSDMMPNPGDEAPYKVGKGRGYVGNCAELLQEYSGKSRGYFIVNPQAFDYLPGGKKCIVLSKS